MTALQTLTFHMPAMMLVAFRLSGLMIYAPVFGSAVIPGRIKVFLCALLGISVYPLLAAGPLAGEVGSLRLDLWSLAPLIAMEIAIGLIIGFIATIPLLAVQTGGLVIGQQMGLGFARFYNPAIDDEADVLGQVLFFLAIAVFLIVGGHEALVLCVLNSFEHIPLGGLVPDVSLSTTIAGLLTSALELALRVSAPLLALIMLETLAMGYIAKTVPQLNILSLGFPLRIIVGLAIVGIGITVISEVMMESIDEMWTHLVVWIEGQGA